MLFYPAVALVERVAAEVARDRPGSRNLKAHGHNRKEKAAHEENGHCWPASPPRWHSASPRAAGTTTESARAAEAPRPGGVAPDKVTLQLKWVTQAQFAGYYAALEQGYYDDENLDVTIKPGGPDIVPEQAVRRQQAEFGIDWLADLLADARPGRADRQHRPGLRPLAG